MQLSGRVGSDIAVSGADTRFVKSALLRLGLYEIPSYGMTDYPDEAMFAGVRALQARLGEVPTGAVRPGSLEETMLAEALTRQQVDDSSSGRVHVESYRQTRRGEAVRVAEHTRSAPGGGGNRAHTGQSAEGWVSERHPEDLIKSANGGWISGGADRGSKECVALVKAAIPELGPTKDWKQGAPLRPGEYIAPGTAIAKGFDKDGNYPSNPSGNHAALFVEWGDRGGKPGMWLAEQWGPRYNRSGTRVREEQQAGKYWHRLDTAGAYSRIEKK